MQTAFETIPALKTHFAVVQSSTDEFAINVDYAELGGVHGSAILRFLSPTLAGSIALLMKRRNFSGMVHRPSNRTDLARQGIKLVGERHRIGNVDCKLALADHVHELDAGEHAVGGTERFEVEHRPSHPLNGAMVLFDDIVEVLDLTYHDRQVAAGVDRIDHRLVGTALVHRDLVWIAVRSHGLVEEALRRGHVALRRQQEVDGLAMLVDCSVEVFPGRP
jgi:hypothetical protein